MGNTQIDQASFLATINHLDGRAENLLSRLNKVLTIFGSTQRIGAYDAQLCGSGAVNELFESLQTGEAALYGALREYCGARCFSELHLFSQCLNRP